MDWKLVGIITGILVVAIPAAKWLINSWAKAKKELEDYRQKTMQKTIDRLEGELTEFKSCVNSLKTQFAGQTEKLDFTDRRISHLINKIDEAVKAVHYMEKNLEQMVKIQVKTEIVNLGKNAKLIRDKQANGD